MEYQINDEKPNLVGSLHQIPGNKELITKVIEFFPYPIQIFSCDGTAIYINKAAIRDIGIRSIESHVGKYNVFKDPIVHELGVLDQVRQVLTGKTVYLTNFNASYKDMIRYFSVSDRDIQTISSDITCFPLINADGAVECFAAVFIIKKIYRWKDEIAIGRRYIETHWKEPFDASAIAKAACLSRAHFTKLFKKHTGITPFEYYINYKISKLKEKLQDTNLSISQAFAACNMDYNSYSSRLFKGKVGVSPSEYRKALK
jgi:AraC family transcriptional regulator